MKDANSETAKVCKVGHYRSWYEVAKKLTNPEEKLAFYEALDAYRFDGVEMENLPPMVDIIMTAIKPSIDADINCRVTGASGGTKKGESKKKGTAQATETPVIEENNASYEETDSTPTENTETGVQSENEEPLTENKNGSVDGGITSDAPTAERVLNTPLNEEKYPPISKSKSKEEEEVEEEVEVEEDDDDGARVTVHAVEDWLESHGLTLSDKDAKKICVSLVTRRLDIDYLDYALKYVSGKSYKSRDGTGNIRFDEIPEGNRKGLYINAVTEWQDMMQGYESWHKDKMRKEHLCPPVQKTPKRPVTCPSCGAQLYESAGESMCIKCNGYLEWGGVAWRIRPFSTKTLAEGIPQMRGTDAATA